MFKGIFSEDYNNFNLHRDKIKSLVLQAQEHLKGGKLYGKDININNPEDIIAFLFVLYRDKELFHEALT